MPPKPPSQSLNAAGLAGVVLCCLLWAGNPLAVKFSVPDLPVLGCAGLRFAFGLPVTYAVCRWFGQKLAVPRRLWWLVGVHVLITVAQIGSFNWGTSLSLAGRSSVFINIHPLVVAPLSWLVLGEKLGKRGLLGLAAAAGGVITLLSTKVEGLAGAFTGDLIVVLSGVIFGAQTIAQKLTFPHIPPATLLLWQNLLSIPVFLSLSLALEGPDAYHFTAPATWGLVYQGLGVSGVCFTLWMMLLRRFSAAQMASMAFLTPLFGMALGWLVRGEPIGWSSALGAALVGLGITLVATDRPAPSGPVRSRPETDLADAPNT